MNERQASQIYQTIQASSLHEIREMLYDTAVRYARFRTDWALADSEHRREMEETRRRAHDALISQCDILSRNMSEAGEDSSWRQELPDRQTVGDFACYVHLFLGLAAR